MDLLKKRLDIARLIAEELIGTIDDKDRVVLAVGWMRTNDTGGNMRIF